MIAPSPGVFGYASIPEVDYPVGLYVVAEYKGDSDGETKKWFIARTALESDDGDGMSHVAHFRPLGVRSKPCREAQAPESRLSRVSACGGRSTQAPPEALARSSPPPKGCWRKRCPA